RQHVVSRCAWQVDEEFRREVIVVLGQVVRVTARTNGEAAVTRATDGLRAEVAVAGDHRGAVSSRAYVAWLQVLEPGYCGYEIGPGQQSLSRRQQRVDAAR